MAVEVVVDEATDAVISQATDIYNRHHHQEKACQKQNAHHNTARCYKGITVPPKNKNKKQSQNAENNTHNNIS